MRSAKKAAAAKAARELDADQAHGRLGNKFSPKMRAAQEALRRMRPTKMDTALATLKRRYQAMRIQFRGTRNHGLGKRLLAGLAFEEIYAATRLELEQSGLYESLACVSKIDRVVATASDLSLDALAAISGYEIKKPRSLWNKSYRTATPIKGTGSIRDVIIESAPAKPYYPRYRVVIQPRDVSGLEAQALASILERLTNPKIQLVEVAFDFPFDSIVDTEFVERYGVFGKSNPRRVGQIPAYDSWGGRKGPKFVKSYFKPEISGHRVELEFHASDLQRCHITDPFHFQRFATLLPGHHIFFGRIDHQMLRRRLFHQGFSADQMREIPARVKNLEWNLSAALNYLRRDVDLKNVRRILVPVDEVNFAVQEALEKWATAWRAGMARVRKK
jgi:hypothetical protein